MKMSPPANNESEVDRNDFYWRQQIYFQVSSALNLPDESNCGPDNPDDSAHCTRSEFYRRLPLFVFSHDV